MRASDTLSFRIQEVRAEATSPIKLLGVIEWASSINETPNYIDNLKIATRAFEAEQRTREEVLKQLDEVDLLKRSQRYTVDLDRLTVYIEQGRDSFIAAEQRGFEISEDEKGMADTVWRLVAAWGAQLDRDGDYFWQKSLAAVKA